jgi:putative ubiquitin-RnfH superfamily antitoxin RatB of RatAB toxin-antitoxin module
MNKKEIAIEVAYASSKKQLLLALNVKQDSTIEEAIIQSGIRAEFPEIDLSVNKVGIFSKPAKLDQRLNNKDRVEIYRKLIADPKEVRKQRAAQGKKMKKGGDKANTTKDKSQTK